MASNYPGGLDDLTGAIDGDTDTLETVDHAAEHVNANLAIEAVQAELGTDPAGSEATVVDRLDALDTTVAAKAASSHDHDGDYDALGAAAAAQSAAESTAASALSSHESDSTSVHGIADTSDLYAAGGTDVAVVDGGTGASTASGARTNLGVDAAGTDNSTDVTLAGSLDYITLSGQEITRGAIDLTTDVTGDLPVADGGTGSSTASAARTALGIVIGTDVAAATVTVNSQAGSYTLVLTDAGKAVEITNASANNLTVPPNSSVAFPTGTVIEVMQLGAGQTSIVEGAGVTVESRGSAVDIAGQYGVCTLRKRATDTWVLAGDLV